MLDQLSAVVHLTSADAPVLPVYGQLPDGLTRDVLWAMCADRPNARKESGHLVVVVPMGNAWRAWVFDKVPPVTELPALIGKVSGLTQAMGQTAAPAPPGPGANTPPDSVAVMAARFASAGRRRRAGVLQALVDGIVETEAAAAAIALPAGPRRFKRAIFSDRILDRHSDELRALARRARRAGDTRISGRVDADEDEGLDTALFLQSTGHSVIEAEIPPQSEAGVALVLLDPAPGAVAQIAPLRDLAMLTLRQRKQPQSSGAVQLRRTLALAAALAAIAYLAWPAPRLIDATGLSRPAEATSVSLHFDAFLEGIQVSVGQEVTQGDVLARFAAPDLEERRAEAQLQIAVEEVTAQAALAQNDYGAFVLSEQRIAAQQRRLENLDARLERLTLRAPVDGVVVQAASRSLLGTFVPTGQQVALIQESQRFALTLNFLRVDAPLIEAEQVGEVYFRGISGESYPFRLTTPVLVERNPETGEERLTARAMIEAPDQDRLLAGLSGYARIEVGRGPRALNFGRYAIEYIKVQAWTYLGLRW